MKNKLSLVLLIFGMTFPFLKAIAADTHYSKYLDFIKTHTYSSEHLGSFRKGEIEIVQDKKTIIEIEEMQKARLLRKGFSKEEALKGSKIGIISEDEYWIWIRDGVIFPTGAKGTYNRIILKREMSDGAPKVAMLPMLPNGKIVLNLSYRHALRRWVLEIPRGFKKKNETNEAAIIRQLSEETGYDLLHTQYLGNMSPDSGSLSSYIPVFLVKVGKRRLSNQDITEAILRSEEFTLDEIKKAICDGCIELDIKGKKESVAVCDSYLTYAVFQAEIRGAFATSK